MGMLGIIATLRLVYRLIQMKSSWIRYELLNMRMNRYFRKSKRITKIEIFIKQCKLGDWFVLYQLSKNLNRPFFVDFLTKLGEERPEVPEDDEEPLLGGCKLVEARYEDDKLLSQMDRIVHHPPPPSPHTRQAIAPLCEEEDTGDTFLEMILQPSVM